jgi:hypothetical protein
LAATQATAARAKTEGWAFTAASYVADRLHEGLDQLLAEPPTHPSKID